ncbi:50S ribosomal protein L16 [Spatholobus suberectus]|nr:50S ribosomal protein L16 [Spatholobus suberectus]
MAGNVMKCSPRWTNMGTHIPDKSVTVRPTETCMGLGKRSPKYWVAVVKPGKILYEMGGVPENIARKAISIASSKMHI